MFVAEGGSVSIVSSDKDLMQLVRPGVEMLDPIKQKPIREAEVVEKFGVPPEKVVEVQALAGDSTDNVPGVPGIGIKTAAQLILEYGDLETLLASTAKIKQPKRREALEQNAEKARISRRLVALDADAACRSRWRRWSRGHPRRRHLKSSCARTASAACGALGFGEGAARPAGAARGGAAGCARRRPQDAPSGRMRR